MNNLFSLTPQQAEQRFEEMMPLFKKIIDQFPDGSYTLGGILGKFARGEWTCWIINEGPSIDDPVHTVIASCAYPNMSGSGSLQIMFVSGSNPDMLVDTLEEFETKALSSGITRIEIIGRAGWTPWLKELGYDTTLRLYKKNLNGGLASMNTKGSA
jgi:hypothetical protein